MTSGSELEAPGAASFLAALLEDDPVELYEHAPCGYVSTLPDGTIIKANETFYAWTGLTPEETAGRRRLQELFATGDRIFYETHYAPMLRMQGHVREIAVELVVAGHRLPVLANSVVKQDAGGAPQLVRTVLFDARERRSYEQELVEARRRAEDAEARARTLSQTLQQSFLPPTAVEIPGLDVAGSYRPAGDGSEVGGDFYDVFETARGSHAVLLGDVSGKGAGAAAVTALARHVVRTESLHGASPAGVLAVLHETVRQLHPDRFCTALLLDVTVDAGVQVTVASGGHQLPLLTDGSSARRVGRPGRILGMLEEPVVFDHVFELAPGESAVLYTDGISEARSDGRFLGDDGAAAIATAHAEAPAAEIAAALTETAVSFQAGHPRDDIAVLVVKRPRHDSNVRPAA